MKLRSRLHGYFKKYPSAITNTIFVLLLLSAASCKKESNTSSQYPIPANLQMVGSGYVAGASAKAVIYAEQGLYVGYNKLYVALYDSAGNSRITAAQISLSAISGSGINGPIENPTGTNASNGLFNAAAVFVNSGSWILTANIQNMSNNATGSLAIPVNVGQPSPAKSYSVRTADSLNLFVSIVQPKSPELGVNDFELVVNRQIDATHYAPDSTYMVAINPTMPAMTGMNSPNNVNPAYLGNGHYAGKVDFIMSGGWNIYVDLARNGAVSDTSHYFTLILL